MRVATNEHARLRAARSSSAANSNTQPTRGVTRPLADVPEQACWNEEEREATIQPTLSLPRLPAVSRQGLIASGKYAAVPARQRGAGHSLQIQAEDDADRSTALLLIPGRAPKRRPDAGTKHYLLYYRLGMALASLVLLAVAGISLSGMRFGAMAFDMATSEEGNAASVAQADYYAGMSGMNFSANTALGQNSFQNVSSAPPPPLARLKPTPPPAAPPTQPSGTPSGPYSSWTPPPGYTSFAVKDFAGDPWAGSFGQCTWWAHYKRPDENFAGMGDAWNWANAARSRGYTVTTTPAPNSTIVFAPGVQGASSLGHVAHVEQVLTGGWVLISEMNFYWNGGGFARVDYRYAQAGSGVWFIH
jgi:surface antigen